MQSLSKSDEQKLLDGVKQAVDLVDNAGLSPNAALKKVAEDFQYSPGFLKAACNAFNNGRQLAQWDANDSILDKLASFPLADFDTIKSDIWKEDNEKSASYSMNNPRFTSYDDVSRQDLLNMDLSSFEKAANDDLHPLAAEELAADKVAAAYSKFEYAKRAAEEARRVRRDANEKLNLKIAEIDNYFRKFAQDRMSFAVVDKAVSTYYGDAGKALMDHLYSGPITHEKRASGYKASWEGFSRPVDRNKEPFTLVAACIKQAEFLHRSTDALQAAEGNLKEAESNLNSFYLAQLKESSSSQPTLTPSLLGESVEKQSSIFAGLAGGAGMGFAKNIAEAVSSETPKKLENQIQELDSPEHLNELRKIRAQTVLTQLMSDPESPLSEQDPEEVLAAYNELVQMSPRLADQPGALSPLLNKKLMGNTEPFEVGEQLKLEKGLKDVQDTSKTTDLMQNETSILS